MANLSGGPSCGTDGTGYHILKCFQSTAGTTRGAGSAQGGSPMFSNRWLIGIILLVPLLAGGGLASVLTCIAVRPSSEMQEVDQRRAMEEALREKEARDREAAEEFAQKARVAADTLARQQREEEEKADRLRQAADHDLAELRRRQAEREKEERQAAAAELEAELTELERRRAEEAALAKAEERERAKQAERDAADLARLRAEERERLAAPPAFVPDAPTLVAGPVAIGGGNVAEEEAAQTLDTTVRELLGLARSHDVISPAELNGRPLVEDPAHAVLEVDATVTLTTRERPVSPTTQGGVAVHELRLTLTVTDTATNRIVTRSAYREQETGSIGRAPDVGAMADAVAAQVRGDEEIRAFFKGL